MLIAHLRPEISNFLKNNILKTVRSSLEQSYPQKERYEQKHNEARELNYSKIIRMVYGPEFGDMGLHNSNNHQ